LLVRRYSPQQIQAEWSVIEGYIEKAIEQSGCDEYDSQDLKKS
jgi:hypothetical protein